MLKRLAPIAIAGTVGFLLAPHTNGHTPAPMPSMSFEELQSAYIQKVGVSGCVAFFDGDYKSAARWFRIIEDVVSGYEGYADGVLRDGKAFDAAHCY